MSPKDITIFCYLCAILSKNYCVYADFTSKEKSDYQFEEKSLKENDQREYSYGDKAYENFPSAVIQEYKKFQNELGSNLFTKIGTNAENQKANEILMPETRMSYEAAEPKGSEAVDVDKIIEDLDNAKAAAEKSIPYLLEKPSMEVNKNKRTLKERWIPFSSHKNSKSKNAKTKTESQPGTPCIDCRQKSGNEALLNDQAKAEPDYNLKSNPKSQSQGPFNYFKINKRSDYPCECPSCKSKQATALSTDLGNIMKQSDPNKFLATSTEKALISFDLDYVPKMLSEESKNLKSRELESINELDIQVPNLLKDTPFGNVYREDNKRRFYDGKGKVKTYRSVSMSEEEMINERRLHMLDEIQRKIDNVQIPEAPTETPTAEINIV